MNDSPAPKNIDEPRSRNREQEAAARVPIPRGERARQRVLRAALEVLADQGLPGLTMEAVARRAGASKATVYRHWASPAAMLVDAMELVSQPFPTPAYRQLRTDLIELVSMLEDQVSHQPFARLMAAFIDAAERDPALWNLHAQLTERRREPLRLVLDEACSRGEIPAETDLELVLDLLIGPAFYRRFVAHGAFQRDYATAIVDHVLAAIGCVPKD